MTAPLLGLSPAEKRKANRILREIRTGKRGPMSASDIDSEARGGLSSGAWLLLLGAGGVVYWLATRSQTQPAAAAPPSTANMTPISLWNTYYKVTEETEHPGAADTPIYAMDGSVIKMVSRAFFADFCIEGSGKLSDGRIVNYAGHCSYQQESFPYCGNSCYVVLDPNQYPWGEGTHGASLVPLRSLATDPNVIPFGTNVYIQEFDGLQIPSVGGLGGFTHNGCFIAQDTGGAITGNHIDIFAGSEAMYRTMESLIPTRSNLTAYLDVTDCSAPDAASMLSGGFGWAIVLGGVVWLWSEVSGRLAARRA